MEAARVLLSDGDEPPVRNVLVSYDEFEQRRQLRRRVMAAFGRLERGRTLDGECRAVMDAQAPATTSNSRLADERRPARVSRDCRNLRFAVQNVTDNSRCRPDT